VTNRYIPDDFFHRTPVEIRFRDLDPLKHVNNAVFNTYLEEARIQFIDNIPELRLSMEQGFSFVLAHIDLKYIKPVFYDEKIMVCNSVKSIGNTRVSTVQAIYNLENELKAFAETRGVWYDVEKKQPAKLPEIKNRNQYLIKPADG